MKWSRLHAAVLAFGLILVGILWVTTLHRIEFERSDAIADATRKNSSLALAYEERTLHTLAAVDQLLVLVRDRFLRDGAQPQILGLPDKDPEAHGVFTALGVFDERGTRVLGSDGSGSSDVSRTEYFARHRGQKDDEILIGRSLLGPSGKWALHASRRIDKPDGSFSGVVVATLDPAYFTRFLDSVELGGQGLVSVIGLDGFARARQSAQAQTFGEDLRSSTLFRERIKAPLGDFVGNGKLDGVRRLYSFRTMQRYPFMVLVGTSEAEALANFHARARNYQWMTALGSVLVLGFAAALMLALSWQARSVEILSETESRYREIFENTKDCIFILDVSWDGRYRIVALNPAEEAVLGLSNAEVSGRFVDEVLPGALAQCLIANYRRCRAHGAPITYVEHLDLPPGARHFSTTLLPIRDDVGRIGRIVGVAHDITEAKRAEDAVRQLNESLEARVVERTAELAAANAELAVAKDRAERASSAKSAFLATVSHEIRTPMNGVLGALELLTEEGLEGSNAELVKTAYESGASLLAHLNDLLDMAKIEAGRMELALAPRALRILLEKAVSTHRANAHRKGLVLTSSIDPRLPEWVLVDELRVGQVLGNLVSNAIKFTAAGSVSLDATLADEGGAPARLRFRVKDSGYGIEAATLGRLFQPFEQGCVDEGHIAGGSGLGLAISRGLAQRMGGAISLDSAPGSGTTATFELPLEAAAPPLPREGGPSGKRIAHRGGSRVLVVDDHPINRMVLTRQLALFGYVAEECEDGVHALRAFDPSRHDLVITDCEMPRMDGYALARAIRRGESGKKRTPIAACTAHATADVSTRCVEAGIDAVLHKPVALADLEKVLARLTSMAASSKGALDAAHLALITGGDDAAESELLANFRRACAADSMMLELAVATRDAPAVARFAHRIKGAAAAIGALRLAAAGGNVETAGLAADWVCVAQHLPALGRELEEVNVHVEFK
ncbi:MAG: response regulator [Usitatibacter sp.]